MNNDAKRHVKQNNPPEAGGSLPEMASAAAAERPYDPELLYVECRACGKPVIWEPGKTTELLRAARVDMKDLDENCLIVSDGCPGCCPHEREGFALVVARLAELSLEDFEAMSHPKGHA